MRVWVAIAYIESGDEYTNVFGFKPTKDQINEVFKEELDEEFEYVMQTTCTECILIEL